MSATALIEPSPVPCCAYELAPLYRRGDGSTVCSLCVEIAVLKAQVKGTPFDERAMHQRGDTFDIGTLPIDPA